MKLNGKTDIGCNRAENQDTFRSGGGVTAHWGVVCDGMGGAQHGKLASAVAADCIEEMLYQQLQTLPLAPAKDILGEAIHLANAEVFARSGGGKEVMGTTVVCGIFASGTFHLSHVGDSRAYLYENATLRQLTRDDSMVQELVDMGTITSAEAQSHPEKNVITKALGVENTVSCSYCAIPLKKDSLVLMCSDGLSNMVGSAKMTDIIERCDFWDLARELVNAALEAGGDDNITVLLMKAEEKDFLFNK